jgi:Fe-S-cluster containining protein
MSATIDLPAAASPEAIAVLNEGLLVLQQALKETLKSRKLNESILGNLDAAFVAYDSYIALVVGAHPMKCQQGCVACCYDNPRDVTGIEAWRLKTVLNESGPKKAAIDAIARGSQGDPALWRKKQIPCPLLSSDKCCSQYKLRPIACRAFHALTPPDWCSPLHPRYEERINPHLDPPGVYLQILNAISDILGLGKPGDLHGWLARE